MTPAASFATEGYLGLEGPAARLARHFGMTEIPHEGPVFVQTYRGEPLVGGELAARYPGPRLAYTSIYGIQTREKFSAMHRLATDELWHFYGGSPVEMLLLHPDGRGERVLLGPDVLGGQHALFRVPAGVWQGSRPISSDAHAHSLVGNTLAPGFDYGDYEAGYRDELLASHPDWAELITALTRDDSLRRPMAPRPTPTAPLTVLTEKMGRRGPVVSDTHSVAHIRLAPGARSPAGYLKTGAETILVLAGRGELVVDGVITPIRAGDVLPLPPGKPHHVQTPHGVALEYQAICVPAFHPDDYVQTEIERNL
jgi:predicted cupin superfamily sugar epimerase/mannose-6-phosphate isomerase-like protein (cupin superfamily)